MSNISHATCIRCVAAVIIACTLLVGAGGEVSNTHGLFDVNRTERDNAALHLKDATEELHDYPPGHCGVYALHAATQALGSDGDFRKLDLKQYVPSVAGSSASDLIRAANALDHEAALYRDFGTRHLQFSETPLILHVRTSLVGIDYNHWVTFLGCRNGLFKVYDPSHGPMRLSAAELLAIWNGTAVAVFRDDLAKGLNWGTVAVVIYWLVPAVVMSVACMKCSALDSRRNSPHAGIEALAIVLLAIVTGLSAHCKSGWGLLSSPSAVAGVIQRYKDCDGPQISTEEMASLVGQDGVGLGDARFCGDYLSGTISGAINIPIDVAPTEFERKVNGLMASEQVIVFCRSDRCSFSHTVSNALCHSGIEGVSIYAGGIAEWLEENSLVQK